MNAPEGPFAIPGGWREQTFLVAGRALCMLLPAAPDAFLDDPDVLAANAQDDYMPYWCYLWPASLETAEAVLRHPWPLGVRALEIGAGTALCSMAALAAGLSVTISDYDPRSIDLALCNARRNGLLAGARGAQLDWRDPPPEQYEVILACDVIYEERNHEPLLNLFEAMLAANGQAWVSDPGRHVAGRFLARAAQRRWSVEARKLPQVPQPGRDPGETDLWILRRRCS